MELILKNKNHSLYTFVYPRADSETIILLHGGPGVPDDFTAISNLLRTKYNIITFHQRGTELSPVSNNDFSIESYLSDLDFIADHFSVKRFHLFGHSWGGLYAQLYSGKNSERILSLFLCSSVSGTGKEFMQTQLEVAQYNRKNSTLRERISMTMNSIAGLFNRDKSLKKLFAHTVNIYQRGFAKEDETSFHTEHVTSDAVKPLMKKLMKHPELGKNIYHPFKITITYGEKDTIGKSRIHVTERYPGASSYVIPGSGHIPWVQNKREFQRILREHYEL
jgi:proline iminopeptidase